MSYITDSRVKPETFVEPIENDHTVRNVLNPEDEDLLHIFGKEDEIFTSPIMESVAEWSDSFTTSSYQLYDMDDSGVHLVLYYPDKFTSDK